MGRNKCVYILRTIEMPAQYANGDQQSDDHESFNFLAIVTVPVDVVVARLALLLLLLRVHCNICLVSNFIFLLFSFLFGSALHRFAFILLSQRASINCQKRSLRERVTLRHHTDLTLALNMTEA